MRRRLVDSEKIKILFVAISPNKTSWSLRADAFDVSGWLHADAELCCSSAAKCNQSRLWSVGVKLRKGANHQNTNASIMNTRYFGPPRMANEDALVWQLSLRTFVIAISACACCEILAAIFYPTQTLAFA